MSTSSITAQNFYQEVAKYEKVYTIKDAGGFPAPNTLAGRRSQPFWSSATKAEKIITNVPAYKNFELVELSWYEFKNKWLPGLTRDGFLVGLNWSGDNATGYDVEPENVLKNIQRYLST